jgi:hypothetical protein
MTTINGNTGNQIDCRYNYSEIYKMYKGYYLLFHSGTLTDFFLIL